MNSIKSIPHRVDDNIEGNYWEETESCAGFEVKNDCPWRFEEMILVSFTPKECIENRLLSCN